MIQQMALFENLSNFLFLIPVIIIGPILFLFISFMNKAVKIKQKMHYYLAGLFGIVLISQLFSFLSRFQINETVLKIIFLISESLELISLFILLIILEMFENNRVYSFIQTYFTILLAVIIGIFISNPEFEISIINGMNILALKRPSIAGFITILFSVSALIYLIREHIRAKKTSISKSQKKLLNWLYLGVFLSQFVGLFIPSIIENLLKDFSQIRAMFSLIRSIGLVIVGIAFSTVSKQPWLLQKQKIQFIMLYSKSGILLYSKPFKQDISQTDLTLFSGAFSAITSLFKETTKIAVPLDSIQFQGKILRVIEQEYYICGIMADYSTNAMEYALNQFNHDFNERYNGTLQNFSGDVSQFENVDDLISKYFT